MSVLAGPFTIACVLLAVAGAAKAVRPRDTAHALGAVGIPRARVLVRVGGAAEAVVGLAALVTGDAWLAALVALSYLAFALFVLWALRTSAPISSCGCFGKADTPPSLVHLVIDLLAAAAAAAVAVAGDGVAVHAVLADQPLAGIPFVLLVPIGAYLTFLSLSALPKLLVEVRAVRDSRA